MNERNQLVDMVAQAVIDKMEEREKVSELADLVVHRVIALQREEAQLKAEEKTEEQETPHAGNE